MRLVTRAISNPPDFVIPRCLTGFTGELRVSVTLFGLSTHLRPLGAQGLRRPQVRPLGGSVRRRIGGCGVKLQRLKG